MRARRIAPALGFALVLAAGAACHHPEEPTVPPRPTNPTNSPLAYQPLEVIDASIVSDAGLTLEAAIGVLDGAGGTPP
jgi:hypothetical protein